MTAPTNLLLNPGFETAGAGGADVFANWVEDAGVGTVEQSTDVAHTGTYSCKLTKGFAKVYQDVTTTGGTHIFRLWTYRPAGNIITDFTVLIRDQTNDVTLKVLTLSPYGLQWLLHTEWVDVPVDCTSVRIQIAGPNSASAYYFYYDDVELFRLVNQQQYLVSFDWDRDALFEDDEGDRLINAHIERGRDSLFGPVGQGVNRDWVGNLVLSVDNEDGRFDPLNASSPLYPNILPGCWVIVQALLSDETVVHLFKGQVTDVRGYGAVGSRKARITASDGWNWAANAPMLSATLQSGGITSELIDAALNAASWPADERVLNAGGDALDYWWVLGTVSDDGVFVSEGLRTVLIDLVESGAATFFFDGQGRAVFRPRTYEYQRVAAVTYTESDLEEAVVPTPWSTVRNQVLQTVSPVVLISSVEVWVDPELPRLLPAGGGVTLTIPVSYAGRDVGITTFVEPVATTDYLANSQEDGSGDDETANVSVSVTYARPTYLVVYLLNSAAHPVYFTELRIRAHVLDAPVTSVVSASDATSQTRYGKIIASITNRWLQNPTIAESVTAWYLYRGKNPFGFLTVRLDGEAGLRRDLFDRVHLDLSTTVGPHADYLISKVIQDIQPKRLINTTFSLEPADSRDFFLIDTDDIDGAAILAY